LCLEKNLLLILAGDQHIARVRFVYESHDRGAKMGCRET
jgi:hypothetical protein